eukprot:CAMPEP_0119127238 /NCGR_PEP_ID=MMETSP1310-20130426/5866_1 /TAXON_ID=464262 /ORGANISM="Genus nov. species nov., Strain RCC2339" /LENGTH=695 /DNA_ID=CAMNT_0007117483 /DNA_START=69 /DNA_END=2156 /DNA_ORIENTATION=-
MVSKVVVLLVLALAGVVVGGGIPGWTCAAVRYNERAALEAVGAADQVTCDCGCGIWDPDCDLPSITAPIQGQSYFYRTVCPDGNTYQTEERVVCSFALGRCVGPSAVPTSWTCEPAWYNQLVWDAGNNQRNFSNEYTSNGYQTACHCGCGAVDPDCVAAPEGATSDTSEFNTVFCKSRAADDIVSVDIADARVYDEYICDTYNAGDCVEVPSGWTCPGHWYNEMEYGNLLPGDNPSCNCGCGVYDPDCDYHANDFLGLSPSVDLRCGADQELNTDNGAYCNNGQCDVVPEDWTCPARYYNERQSRQVGPNALVDCNCECGAFDPDCSYLTNRALFGNGAFPLFQAGTGDSHQNQDVVTDIRAFCAANSTVNVAPTAWTCSPRDWNEAWHGNTGPNGKVDCDCNCGVYDPDCDNEHLRREGDSSELGLYCGRGLAESQDFSLTCARKYNQCVQVPPAWTASCPAKWYNQVDLDNADARGIAFCDCCGTVLDPDCNHLDQPRDQIGLNCNASLPNGGSVNDYRTYCSLESGTSQCVQAPEDWTCAPNFHGEVASRSYGTNGKPDCNCNCGVYDPDCLREEDRILLGNHAFGLICDPEHPEDESRDYSESCVRNSNVCASAPSNWACPANWYAESITGSAPNGEPWCNCNCGAFDPDCLDLEHPLLCGIGSEVFVNGQDVYRCTPPRPVCVLGEGTAI